MKINERGYWENSTNEGHGHDEGLAKALVEFFRNDNDKGTDFNLTIWDIGCGDGYYTKTLNKEKGIFSVGVDGNPYTNLLADDDSPIFVVADMSKEYESPAQDWVLSLEVGEHIPSEFESIFLGNLHRLNKRGIVLSWAIPGQGGDGHVNCQTNADIIIKIEAMGYTWDLAETLKLRQQCAEYPNTGWWFRNTLMVFRRNK